MYIEFWHAHDGEERPTYQRHVWEAFNTNAYPDECAIDERLRSVRRYRQQAIDVLGPQLVEQNLAMARNCGSNVKLGDEAFQTDNDQEFWRQVYGRDQLNEMGRRFRDLKATRGD